MKNVFLHDFTNSHYIYGLSRGGKEKEIVLWDDVKFELAKQTKDFDKNDCWNRNVLFDLMTYQDGGVEGEMFFKILEEFPNLDLKSVDAQGRNLLFPAIMNPAPFNVINFLIDSGVNVTQIDNDGYNLLHMFDFMGVSQNSRPIFELIFESLDNISLKNKYGDNFLDSILLGISYEKSQEHIVKRDTEWFEVVSKKIINGEFKQSVECLEVLKLTLEKYENKALLRLSPNNISRYHETKTALDYFKLNLEVPETNNVSKAKIKI